MVANVDGRASRPFLLVAVSSLVMSIGVAAGFLAAALLVAGGGGAPALAETRPAPTAPTLEFAFEGTVTLAAQVPVGEMALGRANVVPITGGRFAGPGIRGEILPGGWDWQIVRADGCSQINADYMLRTDDGVVIKVFDQGVACPRVNGLLPPARTQPVFEVPIGKYGWLGRSAFVGMVVPAVQTDTPTVTIRFYRVR